MQLLIPIAGHSQFFPKEEFYFPKPLIEVAGRPMIELVIKHLKSQFSNAKFIFVIDREDRCLFSLDRTLKLLAGEGTLITEKPGVTSGALPSCLLAVDLLDLDQPIITVNSDQIIEEDLSNFVDFFQAKNCDAGVVTFDSVHPRWSYIVEDESGNVQQTFEKRVASRHAIAGFIYFQKAIALVEAAQRVILNDVHTDGLFYISSALNEIILDGGRVMHAPVPSSNYHSFYSPAKIVDFERTNYAAKIRDKQLLIGRVNVVIPAAGEGSRFAKMLWKKPKPFIDVSGRPMLEQVIENVAPKQAMVSLLLRKEHMDSYPELVHQIQAEGHHVIPVSRLTEGTASTVLLARRIFDNDLPLLVANSDQLVDFDVDAFICDCLTRGLDGSILVFKDQLMDPKWSFAKLDENGLVIEVAEKKAISNLATVGIYFFAKGCDFVSAAVDMIVANDRVNNEFYTCPVYNYMIKNGAQIGIYEVPSDSMSGLGTPDDLTSFLASRGAPLSIDSPEI